MMPELSPQERKDLIRERISNAASAGTEQPAAQSVAPPAPAPEAAPQPGPDIQALLDQEKAARAEAERKHAEAVQRAEGLEQRVAAVEAQAQQQMQLPSAQELDGMSQGEAIVKALGAMKAYSDAGMSRLVSDVNQQAIEPVRQGLAQLTVSQRLDEARVAHGSNLVNKYGAEMKRLAAGHPDLSGVQLLRLVASPLELSSPPEPTTPAQPAAPAAAYMEGGHSAHASQPSPAQQADQTPQVADYLGEAQKARLEGRDGDANALRRQALKKRLADNRAQTQRAGTAG
jgi:hypothetical protein